MKGQILFTGTLTTVSPFANSPAGSKGADNVSRLPRLPVGGVMQPAIMPSVLRAAFRQAATAEVVERGGGKVSFADFALHAVGGVKGSRKDADEKVGVVARSEYARRQHLVGLFGAGESPAGFAMGAWHIGAAVATNADAVVIEGSRRPLNEDARLVEVLDPAELKLAREYGNINRQRSIAAKALEDEKKALRKTKAEADRTAAQARIAQLEKQLAALEEKAGGLLSDVAIGMPLAGYEVIGGNVTMAHRMSITLTGDGARLGLALASLERFGIDPRIGAHQSQGCGLVQGQWDVALRTVEGRKVNVQPLGRVSIDEDHGCRVEGDALLAAIKAWDEGPFDKALYSAGFDVEKLLG